MRQIPTTAFIGMLALAITGCPSSNDPQTTNPTPSTAPVVVQPQPAVKPPLVAQNPSSPTQLAPGLIQPTNANQRAKQVAKGNRDPFAALFLPVPAPPIGAGNAPSAPTRSPQTGGASTRQTPSRNASNRPSRPSSVTINNPRTASNQTSSSNQTATSNQNRPSPGTTLPNSNLPPALPPAPLEPELAKNVTVMGVVQIGEQTQAIVQVPSEATSRYVQVGQRLSNGQVLVKRIELNAGAEPIVILEQYGVEVSKAVGEMAPAQNEQATPTAAVPYLPPQNTSTPTAELPAAPPQNASTSTAIPSLPLQNTTPLAKFPAPPQNTSTPTAELPAAPPQNINISGVNISFPQPSPNIPATSVR